MTPLWATDNYKGSYLRKWKDYAYYNTSKNLSGGGGVTTTKGPAVLIPGDDLFPVSDNVAETLRYAHSWESLDSSRTQLRLPTDLPM